MKIEPLGEFSLILRDLDEEPYVVAKRIRAAEIPGVHDVVPSFDTVGIMAWTELPSAQVLEQSLARDVAIEPGREHQIPACYALGEDIAEVAGLLGMTMDEVALAHQSLPYACRAIGFCPGFPYLGPLAERIQGIPRFPTPRLQVTPGSIGITGNQTGIYPQTSSGGWRIIARTPLEIADAKSDYFPISAGDRVQFFGITIDQFEDLRGQRL